MSNLETIGKLVLIAGLAIASIGGLLWGISRLGFLGNLPGDIRIERPGLTCMIPLASSILLSLLLTIILNIIMRIINR
ncbi:MAG: DUF2905 domain-containing protein [Chloroflexi bacterium]|nr:DUF2905 domain-containing protein [Chloroflexota bacterium]